MRWWQTSAAKLTLALAFVLVAALSGCVAPAANPSAAAGPAVDKTGIPRNTGPRSKLHVLPASFSEESKRNYGKFIEKLEASGYGNALWQELEDILYDSGYFELLMESPANSQAIRDVLDAKGKDVASSIVLPDKILTINTNIFQGATESLTMLTTTRKQEFHATVHLRYYELDGNSINQAIPATGDAVAPDVLDAVRQATKMASVRLLTRISRRTPGK
jgi:hypothetical protein